jgi:hypothetical protein
MASGVIQIASPAAKILVRDDLSDVFLGQTAAKP